LAADGWVNFTPDNSGLAHEYCHDVAVDDAGRVWIAHHSGTGVSLLDYNGTLRDSSDDTWIIFNPADGLPGGYGWVQTVTVDSSGQIWFGHSLGASRLDHKGTPFFKGDDEWVQYSSAHLNLGAGFVNAILEDGQGCLWFGGDDGLSRMCSNSVTSPAVTGNPNCTNCCWPPQWMGWVWDLVLDQEGHLWVADGNCGAAEWNGAGWSFCDVNDPACGLYPDEELADNGLQSVSLDARLAENGLRSVAVDANNNVWFGSRGRGVARLDGFDDWTLYTTEDEWLGSAEIEGIDFDQKNIGWFATFGGVSIFAAETSASEKITPASGGEITTPDRRAKASFPAGSVSVTSTLTIETKGSFPTAGGYAAYSFDLSASPPIAINQPYTLTILYTEANLFPLSSGDIQIAWWDGGQWIPEPTSSLDAANNRFIATPDHMSLFALVGEMEHIYLPSMRK
jgi:ligand-binding sensor domain-containing protein